MSHEKIVQISHRIMGAIEALDEVEIFEEPNTIRQETVKILTELMHEEEKIGRNRQSPDRFAEAHHSRRHRRVGDPLPEILQRRTAQAGRGFQCPQPSLISESYRSQSGLLPRA